MNVARGDASGRIMKAIASAADRFVRGVPVHEDIEVLLADLGEATDVHRSYVFRNVRNDEGDLCISQLWEWAAPGTEPQIDNPDMHELPYEAAGFSPWAPVLADGELIYGIVRNFPTAQRRVFEDQDIQSIIIAPVFVHERWWGFLGLDDCARERVWSTDERDALRAAAGLCGSALTRASQAERVRDRDEQLQHAQKLDVLGRLAGAVAHDFNNLLTTMTLGCAIMAEQVAAGTELREEVDEMQGTVDRATALTRQLLSFSRKQPQRPSVVRIEDAVTDLEHMLERLAGPGIALHTSLGAPDAALFIDRVRLEQILLNLVANARDAMPRGGRIDIRTARRGGWVVVEVADTGVGIDERIRERIFEPFFTTKGEDIGTGLGLATIRDIVDDAGGRIDVDSTPGRGTTFSIRLPRHAGTAGAEAAPGASLASDGAETILVADDDASVRSAIVRLLRRHGYSVLEAADGAELLERLHRHRDTVDLVLTDALVPSGPSPHTLFDQLHGTAPEHPVVVLSAYPADLPSHRITAVIQKPFAPQSLLHHIRGILDAGRAAPSSKCAE